MMFDTVLGWFFGAVMFVACVVMVVVVYFVGSLFYEILLAKYSPARAVFGLSGCGDPCTVSYNGGGLNSAFIKVAENLRAEGKHLKIDGRCISACAIMADKARPNVCITQKATFEFHKSRSLADGERTNPPQSLDINLWVSNHGGYPEDEFLIMKFKDAQHFWPVCSSYLPLAP